MSWNHDCEICGAPCRDDPGACTNRRCGNCHRKYCGEGGVTGPGHGRGRVKPIWIALYNRHEVKTLGVQAPLVQEIRAVCEPGEDSKKVVRQVLRAHGLVLGPALANDPGPEYTLVVSWNEGGHTTFNGTARLRRRKG